jgi:hypothetical protein
MKGGGRDAEEEGREEEEGGVGKAERAGAV